MKLPYSKPIARTISLNTEAPLLSGSQTESKEFTVNESVGTGAFSLKQNWMESPFQSQGKTEQ